MLNLAFIFFGGDALARRWKVFFILGLGLLVVGAIVLLDLLDGAADVGSWVLGAALCVVGCFELIFSALLQGTRRRLLLVRGVALLLAASLILDFPWNNQIAAGDIFGAVFMFNGALRVLGAVLIRYAHWRSSIARGLASMVVAGLLWSNWPLPDELNVHFFVGLAIVTAGFLITRGSWRLRRMPRHARVRDVANVNSEEQVEGPVQPSTGESATANRPPLMVHIWQATDAAPNRIRLPVFEKYILAISRNGRAYSGHAALECGPDVYISHHPRDRLQINAQNALQKFQATPENDLPGRWGSQYAEEAQLRPSSVQVPLTTYNRRYLQQFWASYRQDDTYNFTKRNCSSAVVLAVESALEGVFAHRPFWRTLCRLAVNADMWAAASIRARANALSWTPGLVLDYVMLLQRITDPAHSVRWPRRAPGI